MRVSSRDAWLSFLLEKFKVTDRDGFARSSVDEAELKRLFEALVKVLDKTEKQPDQTSNDQLCEFNTSLSEIRHWAHATHQALLDPAHDRSWFIGTTLAKIHELVHDHLKPRGYRIAYQIIDFPGGMPGDIGFTLSWGER